MAANDGFVTGGGAAARTAGRQHERHDEHAGGRFHHEVSEHIFKERCDQALELLARPISNKEPAAPRNLKNVTPLAFNTCHHVEWSSSH